MCMEDQIQKAYRLAVSARTKAHASYSQFLVGACFKIQDHDQFYYGCNVENASFGATVCAERVAMWKWVSERAQGEQLEFLVLVTDTQNPVATPCGMCLQVLSEFVKADFPLYICNLQGVQEKYFFRDLMPQSFSLKK